jgi:hypothetical protein
MDPAPVSGLDWESFGFRGPPAYWRHGRRSLRMLGAHHEVCMTHAAASPQADTQKHVPYRVQVRHSAYAVANWTNQQ